MSNEEKGWLVDIKEVELRISHYLILYEGKELTRKQTIAKIIHIQLSEGKVCDECEGTKKRIGYVCTSPCPNCNGTGKLPDRDIEYAIKKCQEG